MDDGLIVTFGLCNCSINHIQIAYDILGKNKLTTISNKFSLFDLAASKEITERMYKVRNFSLLCPIVFLLLIDL